MRKVSKKLLAAFLAVVMAVPTLLVMPFAAGAASTTEWTAVASSDFTQLTSAVSNGNLGYVPTFENKGSALEWSTAAWTGNGEVSLSDDGALYVPDGYIYLTGSENGAVPIKDSTNWRIELNFRFKDVKENGVHVTDGYHADEEHCFIKMYKNTASLAAPENALHDACYFEQNANGQCYAGDYTVGEGATNPDNSVCTGSENLEADTNYKYVAEYSNGVFKAYIQDENDAYVQFINETDDEDFVNALADTANVNSIKIGDDNNSAFFRSLEYKNITFYTGVETGDAEDRMKEAIELYETKMGGDIFTGMTEAYDAYVEANKAYDAWKYGNKDIDLDTYSKALRKKSVAMKQWSYNGLYGTTPWYAADSGDNSAYANNGVANILYWSDPVSIASNENAAVKIDMYAPSRTVLLLDGVKTPAMPIMAFAVLTGDKVRSVYNLYPCVSSSDNANSTYFRLGTVNDETAWYGHNGGSNRPHNWIDDMTSNPNGRPKGEYGTDPAKKLELSSSNGCGGGTKYWASMSNVMKFVGNQSTAVESYSLNWNRLTGDQASDESIFSTSNTIQVVNYKMLLDKMNDPENINVINVAEDTYIQGGLRSLLEAYDQATAFNIYDYDFSNTDSTSSAGSAISAAVAKFNSASVTEDVDGYDDLRKAIEPKKVAYYGGSEGYTEESWAAFAEAYEAAEAIFANIQTTGYNDGANAKAKADALNAVELVTKVDKVDTTNLEISIDEAVGAINNSSMFTQASYEASNIAAVVATAKSTVWGAVANYPNAKDKLDLSDENTAIVEAQVEAVNAAIYALKIDKTTKVASAGEQSMESAIALAATYSADDYGNYADLATAVNNAKSFSVSVNIVSKGCVNDKIADYKNKVRAIINAINLLRPAFDVMQNGTIARILNEGVQTEVDSTERDKNPRWRLYFTRNNNAVVFRTDYSSFTVDLGGATLEWWTSENFDADLDSINIWDESDNTLGEITSSTSNSSISDPDTYLGQLSASTELNSQYALSNLTVTSSSSSILGRDDNGDDITDSSYIFDKVLSETNGTGTDAREGTVTTKKGSTFIDADFNIQIPRETKKKLSAETLPELQTHTLESNIGMVYVWKYRPALTYSGYSHNRNAYTQTTYVMNAAPLFELIDIAKGLSEDEKQYTISSWNEFTTALTAARANMDYGTMTPTAIETECRTRYTNLWNAYQGLEKAATNTSIHAAVEGDEEVGNAYKADNKDGRWSATRWATFKDAYEAAANAIDNSGKYSDTNVRNYGTQEQNTIDAIASALTTAYNELITYGGRADFTALFNAASRQGYEALEDNKYTSSSLDALAEALTNKAQFPYLNMTETERNAVYSETENVQAIANEVTKVVNAYATIPVEAEVDAAALEAAKTTAKAAIKDPDAYRNINEIKALIDAAGYSEDVTIYGDYNVAGVKYDTQAELDEAVCGILDGLETKAYDVQVVDADGNPVADAVFKDEKGNIIASEDGKVSIDYGTRIAIHAPNDERVDWFYSYSSNTVEQTQSKYYTTDMWMNLTVKGDTTLIIKSAASETETVKITYVNATTGKTFAVDYAEKEKEYELQTAPILAYYTFSGYSLEAESEEYVTSITPEEDTIVYANYEFDDANYFTVSLAQINGDLTNTYDIEELEYNDLVSFKLGDGSADDETGGIYNSANRGFGRYSVNGEVIQLEGQKTKGARYTSDEIYAWVIVNEDDFETWLELREEDYEVADLAGSEKVVMYGEEYSFRVCENVYVIPYTEDEFNEAVDYHYIAVGDTNKAAVLAKDKILNETGGQKISMIGSFTLPEGDYELVEAGILFKANTDGTIPTGDLTLANVGTNGIARMKSSQHTAGNQFVISVKTKNFIGTNTTISVIYRAYMIYTDGTNQYVVYSNPVTDSTVIE